MPQATFSIMIPRSCSRCPSLSSGVDLGGLGVDQHRFDLVGIEPVEHVRERAVAPEASGDMELGEETGEGIEHLVAAYPETGALQKFEVRVGEVLVTGDECGCLFGGWIGITALDQTDGTDGRCVANSSRRRTS